MNEEEAYTLSMKLSIVYGELHRTLTNNLCCQANDNTVKKLKDKIDELNNVHRKEAKAILKHYRQMKQDGREHDIALLKNRYLSKANHIVDTYAKEFVNIVANDNNEFNDTIADLKSLIHSLQ